MPGLATSVGIDAARSRRNAKSCGYKLPGLMVQRQVSDFALRSGVWDMNVLISLGTALCFLYSLMVAWQGNIFAGLERSTGPMGTE